MRRVLFDHNVPGPLKRFLRACEVHFAEEMGWATLKNGQLLDAAEAAGFDVLLSSDKTIRYEQRMIDRHIGIVSMSDNHWPSVGEYGSVIAEAVEAVEPGEVLAVFCGTFVPRKLGKPAP